MVDVFKIRFMQMPKSPRADTFSWNNNPSPDDSFTVRPDIR